MCRNPFATVATVGRKGGENVFDPWTATKEEMADDIRDFCTSDSARFRVMQWDVAQEIQQKRASVEAGDGIALIECVSLVFQFRLAPSEWLAECFGAVRHSMWTGEHMSWDDVFGKPHGNMTDRKRLNADNQKIMLCNAIGNYLTGDLQRYPDKTMTRRYEEVADLFPVTPERAARFWRDYQGDSQELADTVRQRYERLGVVWPVYDPE